MRTWVRSPKGRSCGSCGKQIPEGAPALEITIHATRLDRCAPCTKRIFEEDPPETFPEEHLVVPAPGLPLDVLRQPDFVTPAQVSRSARFNSLRQAGRIRR